MGTGVEGPRYAAFISYSHKDAATARALHGRLERYRIPKRLVGSQGEHGPVPARLTPIFRDRDELAAAGDLSKKVRAALAASQSLIVICSPHSAGSIWVTREIAAFRELNPGKPVLAAVIAGEPGECFPEGLGGLDAQGLAIEPLAADLRKAGDGQRLGFLKLVAGLTGVGLDALIQRDAARAIRRVTAVTLTALAATLVMAVLTVIALNARKEADRQRAEAEGLVEFMLTDLRDRLKGVGRLDVLTDVNQRALDHYAQQDLAALSPEALERRARILHAMGEDDSDREQFERARRLFDEARRTTAALLAADPDNPERIFAHSQSEFWVGSLDFDRGNYPAAKQSFSRYRTLANRLVAIDPNKTEWLKEAAFAEGNLCAIAQKKPVDIQGALTACRSALERMEAAARSSRDPKSFRKDIANRLGWLADALRANKDLTGALALRQRQLAIIDSQIADDPGNARLKASRAWSLRAIADLHGRQGERVEAAARLTEVIAILRELTRLDPDNKDWRDGLAKAETELKRWRAQ